MTSSTPSASRPRRRTGFAACLLLGLTQAGCYAGADRPPVVAAVPADYHARHPVVLANAPEELDVFPVGPAGRLDTRQQRDIQVFAQDYSRAGQSELVLAVPRDAADPVTVRRTVQAVRGALAANGVRSPLRTVAYPVADPSLATPLHLSYLRLKADVASTCGQWPADLNSGASLEGWDNRTYYNFGCASTKTLVAQIDDPRDIVRPRTEDPTDVQLRTRAIGKLRTGDDPGTKWGGLPSGSTLVNLNTTTTP